MQTTDTHTGEKPIDWSFQTRGTDAALRALDARPRTTVVSACGTGKSTMGARIAARRMESATDFHLLVLVPNLDLVRQMIEEYRQILPAMMQSVIAVCSNLRGDTEERARDLLAGLDVKITTDPRRLAALLALPGRHLVFCTYPSQPALKTAHREHGVRPWDLAIPDEGHRSVGPASRPWSAINYDALIPCRERVYMTATPRFPDGDDVVSMDDPEIYGEICFTFTAEQARAAGVQAHPRVLVPVLDDADTHGLVTAEQIGAPFLSVAASLAVEPRMLATALALLKAAHELGLKRVITFHNSVAGARAFARTVEAANNLLPEDGRVKKVTGLHVSGSHKPQQRRLLFGRLSSKTPGLVVMASVNVLGEGVNIPAVDTVVFVDPRNSVERTVQAVGRAVRSNGDRGKIATIIVPVMLAPGETPESALSGSGYAGVFTTLCALAAHDEDYQKTLTRFRFNLGRYEPDEMTPETRPQLPEWVTFTGVPVPDGFADAVALRMVELATESWEENYGRASRFHEQHGHLQPTSEAHDQLQTWLSNQRLLYHRNALTTARIARLEALDVVWDPERKRFEEAVAAVKALGTIHVPKNALYGNPPRSLYGWSKNVKERLDQGRLTAWEQAQVEELGYRPPRRRLEFEDWVQMLADYRREHMTDYVSQRLKRTCEHDGQEYKVGAWLYNQFLRWDELSDQQRTALAPFTRNRSRVDLPLWDSTIRAIEIYGRDHNGVVDPPYNEVVTLDGRPYKIGDFAARTRRAYAAGELEDWQIADLLRIDLRLTIKRNANPVKPQRTMLNFDEWVAAVHAYTQKNGTDYVPRSATWTHEENGRTYGIGAWLKRQLQPGWDELTEAQRTQLTPFIRNQSRVDLDWWDQWMKMLSSYSEEHDGRVDPTKNEEVTVDGRTFKIGLFVGGIRKDLKDGKLCDWQAADLRRVGLTPTASRTWGGAAARPE